MEQAEPAPDVLRRIARLGDDAVTGWTRAAGGWTSADRWVVRFASGRSSFVKAAADEDTAAWLRAERRIYASLSGPFLPRMLGWDDDGERPILLLEDLSDAFWPPPWTPERIDQVLQVLAGVRACAPPPGVPSLEEQREELTGWRRVAVDPRPFLQMGLCSARWLERALPDLLRAEAAAMLDGPDLLHGDVRSDNLCFRGSQGILVDWNSACRGSGMVDIGGWLPSLRIEGGPLPETILPDQPEVAALLSGYWAYRAPLPPPFPGARVRQLQRRQLEVALPWAARALELEQME